LTRRRAGSDAHLSPLLSPGAETAAPGGALHRGGCRPLAGLALAGLLAGCAVAPAAQRPHIGARPVFIELPVDRSGRLSLVERVSLVEAIRARLLAGARASRSGPLRVLDVPAPASGTARVTLEVESFDPAGSALEGFLLGFGAGRPGLRARASLSLDGAPESTLEIDRAALAYREAGAGGRERMLADLAGAAAAFVRRRR
jgi:hypothetical protein